MLAISDLLVNDDHPPLQPDQGAGRSPGLQKKDIVSCQLEQKRKGSQILGEGCLESRNIRCFEDNPHPPDRHYRLPENAIY